MDLSASGKSPHTPSFAFRYTANNEALEEVNNDCDDDPPTPKHDSISLNATESSPKKSPNYLDRYFKSMKLDKADDKDKIDDKASTNIIKDVSSSPVKEFLNKRNRKNTEANVETRDVPNETWRLFHDFKYKISQAVEDIKSRSNEDAREKSIPKEHSTSDSEENSIVKDADHSVCDTDNQVSSLDSSVQNLSELTQPITTKANKEQSVPINDNKNSDSTDDTHKLDAIDAELNDDSLMDIESGVEAVEDINMDGLSEILSPDGIDGNKTPESRISCPPTPEHLLEKTPSKSNTSATNSLVEPEEKSFFLNFQMFFLTLIFIVSYYLFPESNQWNGFLFGLLVFCFGSNLKSWAEDKLFGERTHKSVSFNKQGAESQTYTIPSIKEHTPAKKYEGWINHYRCAEYDPFTYNINKTFTSFMKLEGCNLRISYTTAKIGKRALWSEKINNVTFYQHRLYNLTGAKISLLPIGLVPKRQWSKKYPICVLLNENQTIQVLEKEGIDKQVPTETTIEKKNKEMQTDDVDNSPEKKRKFVWRRKDKSTDAEPEIMKEGLRHRLIKKMHREKKSESESVEADKSDDVMFHDAESELVAEDSDAEESEISKIKGVLDEVTETSGMSKESEIEGEWSVQVKQSKDKYSRLYLFARTGREKHEWYRRLMSAIKDANQSSSTDNSKKEDVVSEPVMEKEDDLSMFKITDKDSVTFSKSKLDPSSEPMISTSVPSTHDQDMSEKTFWPYLFKVVQNKTTQSICDCSMNTSEVTWLNTVIARVWFDLMKDANIIDKIKKRIQRKLHSLKLPSFMSPLVVTELSLTGACPLIENMAVPTWDERGIWFDSDFKYQGGAYITIQTQINLMKLKDRTALEENMLNLAESALINEEITSSFLLKERIKQYKPAIYNSDVDDSPESSDDETNNSTLLMYDSDDNLPLGEAVGSSNPEQTPGSSKKKFLRMVDKIATNKYFQQVTDYKVVKRALEGISNTDIRVQLDINMLEGRLVLNLPPPPHDRLWIGFRSNPQLELRARPAFGARSLRFSHITNMIEQRLSREFEKILVLPNMEDIPIEILTPTPTDFE